MLRPVPSFALLDNTSRKQLAIYAGHEVLLSTEFHQELKHLQKPLPQFVKISMVFASVHGISDSHIRVTQTSASRASAGGPRWNARYTWYGSSYISSTDVDGEFTLSLIPRVKSVDDLRERVRPLLFETGFLKQLGSFPLI